MIGIPKISKTYLRYIALRTGSHTGNNLYMTLHRLINQKTFRTDRVDGIHYKIESGRVQQFGNILVFQVNG